MCSASGYLVPAPQGHWPCVNTFHVLYLEVCVSSLFYPSPPPYIVSFRPRPLCIIAVPLSSLSTSADNIFDYMFGTTIQPMIYLVRTEVSIYKQIRVLFYKASKRLIVLKYRTLPPLYHPKTYLRVFVQTITKDIK